VTLSRKDHRAAILTCLRRRGPQSLSQIVAYLKASNVDSAEYDLRRLRAAGKIRTVRRLWEAKA